MPTTKRDVLRELDGIYLLEYLSFSGQLREYVSDTLSKAFKVDRNEVRRRHHVVSLVQLEYAAYEDAAALLKALIAFRTAKSDTVLETLESYRPGEAVIAKVLEECGITSPDGLFVALRLEETVPAEWTEWFPEMDLKKTLRHVCQFLTLDCRANHKELGVAAYNKSKHGPSVVADGRVFGSSLAGVPSMFFRNRWPEKYGPNPVIIYGFPMADSDIEERERLIHFIQRSLRLIVAALVTTAFQREVVERHGSVRAFWNVNWLTDVRELIQEITKKK